MRRAFLQALVILLLLLVPCAVLWIQFGRGEELNPESAPTADHRGESHSANEGGFGADSGIAVAGESSPESSWENEMVAARDSRDRRAGLRIVAETLQTLDSAEAVTRILAYLESGRDVESRLPFALGSDGVLASAPSLRIWLLDWMGRIDPAAAAALAHQAFAAGPSGSADEWAIHLRNHAWGRPDEVATVVQAAVAMLGYRPWREAPSTGFQESFDVFVWAQDVAVVPELVTLIPTPQPESLSVPANLALDRLVLKNPVGALSILMENLNVLDSEPFVRAGYFARADLGSSEQSALLEDYFLDRRLTGEERDYFLELIPNLNLTFSHNLLSENPRPTYEWGNRQLDTAAALLNAWLADPRFAVWKTEIRSAVGRVKAAR